LIRRVTCPGTGPFGNILNEIFGSEMFEKEIWVLGEFKTEIFGH